MSKYIVLAILLVIASVQASLERNVNDDDNTTLITIATGQVQGFINSGVRLFLGIPYGESTEGNNRWAPPVPKASWDGVLDATEFKPSCPQTCILPTYLCPTNQSEDCLNVNVYAPIPTEANPGPWPVMIFIYGGGFLQGTSMVEIYSGKYLAQQDVVVVTADYRVGVLGFMVTNQVNGNFGILDQRMYMQWVQDNIAAFGGDASQVTLFGESAGAMSTAIHWTNSDSWGLFDQVIMESEPLSVLMPSQGEAQAAAGRFAYHLGCDFSDIDCMRGMSVDDVVAAGDAVTGLPNLLNFTLEFVLVWQPNIDGDVIKEQVLTAVSNGNYKQVPVILGSNQDEGTMFLYAVTQFMDDVEYAGVITGVFGVGNVGAIMNEYPVTADPVINVIDNISNLFTDYLFACPGRWIGDQIANDVNFYLYHFDHVLSFYESWGPNFKFCMDKCCHGSELPFVFHTAEDTGFSYTPEELDLTNQMVLYWTNFAKTGNPNNGYDVAVAWPQYDSNSQQNIHLATPIDQESGYVQGYCNFWDTLGYFF